MAVTVARGGSPEPPWTTMAAEARMRACEHGGVNWGQSMAVRAVVKAVAAAVAVGRRGGGARTKLMDLMDQGSSRRPRAMVEVMQQGRGNKVVQYGGEHGGGKSAPCHGEEDAR